MEKVSNLDGIITILFVISLGWGIFTPGKRNGFFFFLPYIICVVTLSYIGQQIPEYEKYGFGQQLMVYIGISLVIGIIEYYGYQPICHKCHKRLGMRKLRETDHVSNDYIGTKMYSIKNKSGNKIGEYEAPVTKRRTNYKGHYHCKYCGAISIKHEYNEHEL